MAQFGSDIVAKERIRVVAPEGDARFMRVAISILASSLDAPISTTYTPHIMPGATFSEQEIGLRVDQVEGFEEKLKRAANREGFSYSTVEGTSEVPRVRLLMPAYG